MKRTLTLLLFLVSLSALAQTGTTTVYTTDTGTKYHQSGCRYLSKSKHETTITEAKASGYEACSVCKPGGAATTSTPAKTATSGRCTATTKAGTPCKRNAAPGSTRCWQH